MSNSIFHRRSFLIIFLILLLFVCQSQDSLNITILGSIYDNWYSGSDIAVSGEHAFIAVAEKGMRVIDFSDPFDLVEVASFVPDESIRSIS
ncbi:hypothetical protein K8I28_14295 [bacterium]|nr:hypothetical protein [bacterium]